MLDEKYIVFKRSDWESEKEITVFGVLNGKEVEDAVVIRRQDVFAPPALEAYANTIMASVEGMASIAELADGNLDPDAYKQSARMIQALRDIADYFHQQAEASYATKRKLPD